MSPERDLCRRLPLERRRRAALPALLVLAVLLFVSVPLPAAEVYRWRDAEGRVHFGDQPPDQQHEIIEIDSRPPPAAPELEARRDRQRRLLDALTDERLAREDDAAEAAAAAEERAASCADARERLQRFRDARALYRDEEDGERTFLTDAERETALAQAEAAVAAACG